MSVFLFNQIVFGPVRSRRFGVSLGINLLPFNSKLCSFNCVYCECGNTTATPTGSNQPLARRSEIIQAVEQRFSQLRVLQRIPDSITFAGNGEPTLHPEFPAIIFDVIRIRNLYLPESRITVLSNATFGNNSEIIDALMQVDNNVMKLDAGYNNVMQAINRPLLPCSVESIVETMLKLNGMLKVQSLFLRATINHSRIDNTANHHVDEWLHQLKKIRPRSVMIYPVDRATAENGIEKISSKELEQIAQKVSQAGINTEVFC
ncbi:MAG TPA: radical SAM protein [Bacteroidales bacterium]|nr:radical SAM protein [Bacteroidales bacterium]